MITRILMVVLVIVCLGSSAILSVQDRELQEMSVLLTTANKQSLKALDLVKQALEIAHNWEATSDNFKLAAGSWKIIADRWEFEATNFMAQVRQLTPRHESEWDVPTNRLESFINTGTNVLWITNIITHGLTNQ